MHPLFNRFLAFLALLSVLSSSAWVVSPAVLADDIFTPDDMTVVDMHLQAAMDEANTSQQAPTCNHACHFSAHILCLVPAEIANAIPRLDAGIYTVDLPGHANHPFPKGLYRPPISS